MLLFFYYCYFTGVEQALRCIETYFNEVNKMMEVTVDAASEKGDTSSTLSEREWTERHVKNGHEWRIWPFIDQ